MKKSLIGLVGLIIIVGGLFAGGYYWWRPRVANQLLVDSTDAFLIGRDNDDISGYAKALTLIDRAIAWGRYDSTIGLYRAEVLAGLGRFDAARQQLEKVRDADPSAKEAATDLLNQLSGM